MSSSCLRLKKTTQKLKKTIQTSLSREPIVAKASRGLLVCLLLLVVAASASAQGRWTSTADTPLHSHTFVVSQNENGEAACRDATSEERGMTVAHKSGGPMRVIYSGAPRRKDVLMEPSVGLRTTLA